MSEVGALDPSALLLEPETPCLQEVALYAAAPLVKDSAEFPVEQIDDEYDITTQSDGGTSSRALTLEQDSLFSDVYADKVGGFVRMVRKRYSSIGDPEGVVHDAFVSLARHPEILDQGLANTTSWLYKVVQNAALTQIRTDKRHPSVPVPEFYDYEGEYSESGYHAVELRQLFSNLDDDVKTIGQLRLLGLVGDGYIESELSVAYDVAVGTIRSRTWRARRDLRRALNEQEFDIRGDNR